jgi:hypothetical protein
LDARSAATSTLPAESARSFLSHAFWQGRYGGDPSIVGRRIRLSGPEFLPDSNGDYVAVSQRAVREIGIRKALGATTAGVLR